MSQKSIEKQEKSAMFLKNLWAKSVSDPGLATLALMRADGNAIPKIIERFDACPYIFMGGGI